MLKMRKIMFVAVLVLACLLMLPASAVGYIIGAAVLALILVAGIGITRKGKSGAQTKPQPPAPPQSKPDQKSISPSPPASAAKPTQLPPAIEIKRGYEVLPNNDLRFGIRIKNDTEFLIADVETKLDLPKTLFTLKGDSVQSLANIHPNGERTATYVLTPRGCIHNEDIEATAFYRDHTGKKQTIQMRPKEVHCVCPFLKGKAMREGEFAELADRGEYIQEGLSFSGISVNKIAEFIKESCAHRLYVISEHDIGTARIVNLAGESLGEKAYYLLTAVIQPHNNVTHVALRAYSDKPYGLHGFLNEIANSIRHLVSSVQSAKEIGIIESKQVITIIDSVVQRTSFGGTGEGPGAPGITIEGSVVQRSAIGDSADNGKKCSHCGKGMSEDERFCPNCGTQMK